MRIYHWSPEEFALCKSLITLSIFVDFTFSSSSLVDEKLKVCVFYGEWDGKIQIYESGAYKGDCA
jgi:hypothetical protein